MSRPLFAITSDLLNLLDTDVEEVSPDLEVFFAALEAEEGAKLDGYLNAIKSLQMEADAAKVEADAYLGRAKVRTNRIDMMKVRLKQHLELTGRTSITTATGRPIRLQKNGGVVPLLIDQVDVATCFPTELTKVKVEVDRDKIREKLEAGEVLQWARLGERGTSLRIG